MAMDKFDILGVKVNNLNMDQACQKIFSFIDSNKGSSMVVTPNAEMIMRARDNKELADILNNAELSLPDGAGVLLASHLLQIDIKERVSGFDLMVELLSNNFKKDYSVYFLGGRPGIAEKMVERLRKEPKKILPGSKIFSDKVKIFGFQHGYLDKELKTSLIDEINDKRPDILFVGMGAPLQEKFLEENMDDLEIKVGITVGGSFDVLAGELKRAPDWMQKAGLEWLFRLFQEPARFKRMLALPHFALLAILKSVKNKFNKVES